MENIRIFNKKIVYVFAVLAALICLCLGSKAYAQETSALVDGEYEVEVFLEGGSGRATITSPTKLRIQDGRASVLVEWSSRNYDYMIVKGEKYYPINEDGNSVFDIPVDTFNEPIPVIGDTTAMSTPHEIEYEITISYTPELPKEESRKSISWEGPYFWVILVTLFLIGLITFLLFKKKNKAVAAILILILILTALLGFYVIYHKTPTDSVKEKSDTNNQVDKELSSNGFITNCNSIPDKIGSHLVWKEQVSLEYAKGFLIDYYEDEETNQYKLITIADESAFLVVPELEKIPEDIPKEYKVIEMPSSIYLVASPVMDMMVALDAMEHLKFSGHAAKDWYIDEAKRAVENGEVLFAGKYSAPDYELILEKGCDLTIENTMIYHTPEVKEKLETLGIPVLVDRSSYEQEPLGRMEWIKLYGALLGKEQKAEEIYNQQRNKYQEAVSSVDSSKNKPKVAFFYISAGGDVKVKKSTDYIVKMIEAAGGEYVFGELLGDQGSAMSTVNMSLEEFYQSAKDADYIIYNSTIEGEIQSIDDLISKSKLMGDMKAVKEGNVFCTSNNLYQSTMELGDITSDFNKVFDGEKEDLNYLNFVK